MSNVWSYSEKADPMAEMLQRIRTGNVALRKVESKSVSSIESPLYWLRVVPTAVCIVVVYANC